jgi:hypothetical protein
MTSLNQDREIRTSLLRAIGPSWMQYERARGPLTNSFGLHLTGKGKITAIKAGTEPRMAAETADAVEK